MQQIPRICSVYAKKILRICSVYAKNMLRICSVYAKKYPVYARIFPYMLRICPVYVKKIHAVHKEKKEPADHHTLEKAKFRVANAIG